MGCSNAPPLPTVTPDAAASSSAASDGVAGTLVGTFGTTPNHDSMSLKNPNMPWKTATMGLTIAIIILAKNANIFIRSLKTGTTSFRIKPTSLPSTVSNPPMILPKNRSIPDRIPTMPPTSPNAEPTPESGANISLSVCHK